MTAHNAAPGCATRWATLWLVAALSVVAVAAQADHLKLGNEGVYPPSVWSHRYLCPYAFRVSPRCCNAGTGPPQSNDRW